MVDERVFSAVLSELTGALLTSSRLQSNLDTLVGRIAEVLPATSAAITLITPGRSPRHVAASDDHALQYQRLQTDLLDGPCLLAHQSGGPVAVPDLQIDQRFSHFGPAALHQGLRAVFSFPLRRGDSRLGALDVYRDVAGPFDCEDMAAAQTLTDLVAACLTVRSGPMRWPDATVEPIGRSAGGCPQTLVCDLRDITDPSPRTSTRAAPNTARLLRLVSSMLDLARVDSGPDALNFADADLAALAREAVAAMLPVAEHAGVHLVMIRPSSVGPVLNLDGDRIVQTITNLLSNAVKFSPPGRFVEIAIDGATHDDAVVARVADHGRGIHPGRSGSVFSRFPPIEPSDTRGCPGLGLGLALCKSIVEAHQGKIWMEATPGGGATCLFKLPLLVTRAAATGRAREPGRSPRDEPADGHQVA